ncbi:hypothetical protein J7643_02670 [bacterium]|nr:hypothetical protein [bacterium]
MQATEPLSVPLDHQQIAAANRLHARLTQWVEADQAITLLKEKVPGFDVAACVLKATAVNQLYGTNVFAISRMARHISEVMQAPPASPDEFVKAIATLSHHGTERMHVSFAAKFAHFFIDQHVFLIYDSYAERMVKHHLGVSRYASDKLNPYRAFVRAVGQLRAVASLTCSAAELDRYLWLAGLCREWRAKGPRAQINAEVLQLLETSRTTEDPDVLILLGETP